jgi:hypothetical protein
MKIVCIPFQWSGKDYTIKVELEKGDIAHGDFIAQAYLNGKPISDRVRENALNALAESAKGKLPFADIVTVTEYNIKQGFNLKAGALTPGKKAASSKP